MAHKATIGLLIAAMVAFFVFGGVWAGVRLKRVDSGPAIEEMTIEQIVRLSKREEFYFNAMFISGNLALVFLAHFGALRHRRRLASKRVKS